MNSHPQTGLVLKQLVVFIPEYGRGKDLVLNMNFTDRLVSVSLMNTKWESVNKLQFYFLVFRTKYAISEM